MESFTTNLEEPNAEVGEAIAPPDQYLYLFAIQRLENCSNIRLNYLIDLLGSPSVQKAKLTLKLSNVSVRLESSDKLCL